MVFPETQRVIYDLNPLFEVVFQVRFPRNLEIETQVPVLFQKRIQETYPVLQTHQAFKLENMGSINNLSSDNVSALVTNEYRFISQEGDLTVILSNEFLAFRTVKYTTWELFRDSVSELLDVFFDIYKTPILTRIGLRYRNIIYRKALGLENYHWKDLINSSLTSVAGEPKISPDKIVNIQNMFTVQLENGTVDVRHGLVRSKETNELGFSIDSDFSKMETIKGGKDVTLELLGSFNAEGRRLFRWAIQTKLHDSLRPRQL